MRGRTIAQLKSAAEAKLQHDIYHKINIACDQGWMWKMLKLIGKKSHYAYHTHTI